MLIVDFAEIENGSLYRLARTDAMVLIERKTLGLHSTVFCESADENTRLNNKNRGKRAEKCPRLRKTIQQ